MRSLLDSSTSRSADPWLRDTLAKAPPVNALKVAGSVGVPLPTRLAAGIMAIIFWKAGAKIVAFESRLWIGSACRGKNGVEEVPRVQIVVAEKLKQFSVIFTRAGTRGEVHNGARIPAVLRWEGRVVDLVFRQRVNRRLKRDLVLHVVIEVDTVN